MRLHFQPTRYCSCPFSNCVLFPSSNWLNWPNHRSCVSTGYSKTEHQTTTITTAAVLGMHCNQLCTRRHPYSASSAYIVHAVRLFLNLSGTNCKKLRLHKCIKGDAPFGVPCSYENVSESRERWLQAPLRPVCRECKKRWDDRQNHTIKIFVIYATRKTSGLPYDVGRDVWDIYHVRRR